MKTKSSLKLYLFRSRRSILQFEVFLRFRQQIVDWNIGKRFVKMAYAADEDQLVPVNVTGVAEPRKRHFTQVRPVITRRVKEENSGHGEVIA